MNQPDHLAIQDLTARYALAMDEGRFNDWLSMWSDDGVFSGAAGVFEGRQALIDLVPKLSKRAHGKRHVITNSVIDVTDSDPAATQTCYMLIIDTTKAPVVLGTAVYRDKLIKAHGQWKFRERRVEFDANYATR